MKIDVIYEDEDILVINKPAGMTVNRADTTRNEETVQDWSELKIKDQISKIIDNKESDYYKNDLIKIAQVKRDATDPVEKSVNYISNPTRDFVNRGGIVHRLDKETSGVLVLAKNPESFIELQRQFKERIVEKVYIALAHGKLVPDRGVISEPVGRLPWNRMQFGVVPGGRESVTNYKVTSYYRGKNGQQYSYVELNPKTGRTHQIRVHLKYIGYPIFADFLLVF